MNSLVINAIHHDLVINAIQKKTLNTSNLHFSTLRKFAGIDSDKRDELDRGRLTIHRQDLLNQYLYSYGLMVQRQWLHTLPKTVDMLNDSQYQNLHIYDYGCGQGLATLLFLENLTELGSIDEVTLIEPSQIALQRARQIIGCVQPEAEIHSIHKKIDDLNESDLQINPEKMNIHLFSNVLDIDSFDQFEVFNKILKDGGTHYVIAISNDRNCYGGTKRLQSLYKALLNMEQQEGESLSVTHTQFERFTDTKNMNHVYFCLKIEIN